MAEKQNEAKTRGRREPVMRTFVRAWLACAPEYGRTGEGVGVCRLRVVGEPAGPVSSPPRVVLYIGDGVEGVRPGEARRCADGLREGDLIEAVGDIGPERRTAHSQEIIVSAPVKLRGRPERHGGRVAAAV
jgi:hypothetical protein